VTQVDDNSADKAPAMDAATDDQATGVSLGEKLRAAREQQSLSLEQVSEALHLDEEIITSLEQGRFETLGAPVYVRGHLKTYTQLLGLSVDEVLSTYLVDAPEPVTAATLRQPKSTPATVNPVVWAGGALIILLGGVLGVYLLLGNNDAGVPVAASDDVAVPFADTQPRTVPAEDDVIEAKREAPVVETDRAVAMPEVRVVPPATKVEANDRIVEESPEQLPVSRPVATMRLGLHFSQESWVEISDANRRLLFGLQHEGNRREISGEPPFNLLIGNAQGVELTINDEPFAVPVSRVRGKVARFEITGEESE